MQAGAGPLPPHQAAHLQGAPVNIQPQQQPFYVPDHAQGQVAYSQQMHLAMQQQQQQQRGNFQPRGVNPSGGGIQAPAFMQTQMMPSFQSGPPSMPGRSLTNPIQPHYVTPQLFPMQLPHHMMGPPPPNGPPQHMISVINPTFQPQHMGGMMPPENGPMSMSNEGNINQQADGQMMTNPQQIAQQQMVIQTGEYGEQPMMMPYQHMAPPTSMSGPPPVFRGQSQQFFPSSTNQMPPMSMASGQAPPHHIPGHGYMGPLPPSLMGPRNGGGGAPTFPPNPIQPGQNIQPQYYPPGAPQPFYNQQAGNMQQPVRYNSPGAMSQRSYSSRGGRGNYRGGYSNQRDNRSISRQTSVNSEAPSMSADDHHRKNSVDQAGYQMDSMAVSSAAGEHQEESGRQSANAQAHDNERPSSRNANHFAHPFSAPSSSARRNGSPKNQDSTNLHDSDQLMHTDTPSTTGACTPEDVTTVASSTSQQTLLMQSADKTLVVQKSTASVKVLTESKKPNSNAPSVSFCCKCRGSGEPSSVYENHRLRDPVTNKVTCPKLLKERCESCNATGPEAHHTLFCPNSNRKSTTPKFSYFPKYRKFTGHSK